MENDKHGWDLERAAAWLRRHGWGEAGEERVPQLEQQAVDDAAADDDDDEEIDIACWPALVAPFYD